MAKPTDREEGNVLWSWRVLGKQGALQTLSPVNDSTEYSQNLQQAQEMTETRVNASSDSQKILPSPQETQWKGAS